MFLNLQRGMSILNTLRTTANQMSKWQRMKKNYRGAKNMRTFADAEKSNRKEPQKPADTYDMLKKSITLLAMFLLMLFG